MQLSESHDISDSEWHLWASCEQISDIADYSLNDMTNAVIILWNLSSQYLRFGFVWIKQTRYNVLISEL